MDRLSRWYDLLAEPLKRSFREAGLRKLAIRNGERVLEIGFGTGHALGNLARSAGSGGRVWGIDISHPISFQRAILMARHRSSKGHSDGTPSEWRRLKENSVA